MASAPRQTHYDKALFELRRMILSGQFELQSRISEAGLAEMLNISRTPLRQALMRLVEEGLVERLDTGRSRVASFTMEDIVDAIEIRGTIEGAAARMAAERGADPKISEDCARVLDQLDLAVGTEGGADFPDYVELNAEFHKLLSQLAGSRIIEREVARASRLPLASPSAFLQGQEFVPDFRASLKQAQAQHRAIFDAILNREGARAEALAREHARLARQNLNHVMKSRPGDIEKVPGLALLAD